VSNLWSYTNLTPEDVYNRLVAGDTVLVLDVREISEYIGGHMAEPEGHLPLTPANFPLTSGVLEAQFSLLPRDIDIIVYCRSGGRSAVASSFLEGKGFNRIYNMTGGFSSWPYESRPGRFGDQSGTWIHIDDPSPVMLTFDNVGDTNKILISTASLTTGYDSVYVELHQAPVTAQIPPGKPSFDIENIFRLSVLDPFGLDVLYSDSMDVEDSVSIYLSLNTDAETVLNPEFYTYGSGKGWTSQAAQFEPLMFSYTDDVLRKWYYLGAELDPTKIDFIENSDLPDGYQLSQNYPNPFNPVTMINYQLPESNDVELNVYNLIGQKVMTLVSSRQQAGKYSITWDASGLASGIYYYELRAGKYSDVKKMVYIQ
jgi:rhodanese-related sulfurtransferase